MGRWDKERNRGENQDQCNEESRIWDKERNKEENQNQCNGESRIWEDGTRKGIERKTWISVMRKVEYGKMGQGNE